jgi:hypothetical protein
MRCHAWVRYLQSLFQRVLLIQTPQAGDPQNVRSRPIQRPHDHQNKIWLTMVATPFLCPDAHVAYQGGTFHFLHCSTSSGRHTVPNAVLGETHRSAKTVPKVLVST